MSWSQRRVSWVVLALGGLGFAAVAWWFVPWHPVPWRPGPSVSATDVLTAEQIGRAESYARTARLLGYASLAVSLTVVSLLGFTPWGRRLVDRLRGPWPVRVALAAFLVLWAGRLATLPLALVLRDHVHDYGLSDQPLSAWFVDQGIGLLVQTLTSAIALVVLIGAARRWPRAWPAVAGTGLGALVVLGSFVYPVLVEPLFNDFQSLGDGPLRTEVLRLADREGVPVDDVLVADASRRTTTLNAYVSGFGGTRRVVLYDNLVNDVPRDQVVSVVAHELGHAKYDDVVVGSALGALGTVASLGLLGLLLGPFRGSDRRPGPRSVPLVLALVAWGSLLAAPVENGISRRIETRADVTALETTHDSRAFIDVQRQLAVRGLSDPTPPVVLQWWFGSHPTVLERVALGEEAARN